MNSLKRLGAAVVLTFVLGVSVFAGDILTPPCAPGDISTPPCAAQMSADDSAIPGEVETPPASYTVDILSVVDAAMNLLLLF